MAKMIAGLKPRGFTWVIADRLAVSERVGGIGFQHRRVRRDEEIAWLRVEAGITTVVSLLPGNQNVTAYTEAGLSARSYPIPGPITGISARAVHDILDETMTGVANRVLVHREVVDDDLAGLLGGYLIHATLVTDPVLAVAVIQEILGRPLGPTGRSLITPTGP